MKKTKIIFILLLGSLLIVPFMTTTRAQPPSYVGVQVGEYYQWDQTINYGADFVQWFADNMTAHWDKVWGHTAGEDQNITNVHDSWITAGPQPNAGFPADIEVIYPENTTTGTTTVSGLGGYLVLNYPLYDVRWTMNWTIANDTATFVELTGSGSYMTTPGWLMYTYIFAPRNVNWAEYVALGNIGLGAGGLNITNPEPDGWGANITLVEITNGFSMQVPVMGWWNNTLPITINTTYNTMGWLESYTFEYGTNMLFDIIRSAPISSDPIITSAPSDFSVDVGYTGETISWTATDTNPSTYTIELQGTGVVAGPTAWSSGVAITYNVPDGLSIGPYTYEVNFTDGYGNSITDEVIMTVQAVQADTTDPVITDSPSDLTVETGYIMASLSWTATDENPNTYTIELQGTGVVAGPSSWSSGVAIPFIIPIDLEAGEYSYTINITDDSGNYVTDTVIFTVQAPEEDDEEPIPGYELPIVLGVFTFASIGLIVIMKKKN